MPLKVERTLFKIGEGSFAVILPKAWITYHRLKPGEMVEIIINDSLTIHAKKRSENEADRAKSL